MAQCECKSTVGNFSVDVSTGSSMCCEGDKLDEESNLQKSNIFTSLEQHSEGRNGLINHADDGIVGVLSHGNDPDMPLGNFTQSNITLGKDTEETHMPAITNRLADDLSTLALCNDDISRLEDGDDDETIDEELGIRYVVYESEAQMPDIMRLITNDLSEPYSIYTYRYFIHNWPKLCFIAMDGDKCVGAIVCKHDMHKRARRGYIAMLAVDRDYRRRKIGSHLVKKAIDTMVADDCDEVVLETEITNHSALALYQNLGFVRDKRLFRYYLNGVDALRLKLWIK